MRHRRGTGLGPLIASILIFFACALLAYQLYNDVEEEKKGARVELREAEQALENAEKDFRIKRREIAEMRKALGGSLHEVMSFDPAYGTRYIPDMAMLTALVTEDEWGRDGAPGRLREWAASENIELGPGYEQTFPGFVAQAAQEESALSQYNLNLEVKVDEETQTPYYAHTRNLHKDMVEIIRACTKFLNERRDERGNMYQVAHDHITNNQALIQTDRDSIDDFRERLKDLEREYTNEISSRNVTIANLGTELAGYREQLGEEKAKAVREQADIQAQIAVLSSRIADLLRKRQKTQSETAADGEVIHVDESLGYAWVDLGHNHGARPGMKFEVFSILKGGRKQVKGMVEIREVHDDRSQASIIEGYTIYDPELQEKIELPRYLNPIIKGDRIRSPFFDPEEEPVFVFVGENLTNPHYSMRELTLKIQEIGGRVEDEVTIETDFVIAIERAEESTAFETALQFGINIMRERDLLKFLRR